MRNVKEVKEILKQVSNQTGLYETQITDGTEFLDKEYVHIEAHFKGRWVRIGKIYFRYPKQKGTIPYVRSNNYKNRPYFDQHIINQYLQKD